MKNRLNLFQFCSGLAIASCLHLSFFTPSLQAGDPFRQQNPQAIGDHTEAAFKAIFIGGDYPQGQQYLQQAQQTEADDPLVYAMIASMAYIDQDWEQLGEYATQTREVAKALMEENPLRGNLYIAVGHFMEGGYALAKDGPVRGAPQALNQLQEVLKFIKEAERIRGDDPELNLIKGYMDLMLAVNLPFADPQQAIARLENLARPQYLAYRGIAMAYRDLGDYPNALEYVNLALTATPNHPEVHYLKAQILKELEQWQAAQGFFNRALSRPQMLPKYLVAQIFFESCQNQRKIDQKPRNCDALRDPIKEGNQIWGPERLPSLD
ncbi:tetratricopeptide repeat protein [Roseofilum sp. BLCC_M91]|uniref:Tetratricopeptide repeat protein n=1 Tax=Roseofilum halophilum BLCC-M91 TaxID=3022259 RepID=A0ABT7BLC6_9CYAN|nr:Sll0314/Alr1548 family TPR repeat-containing protein [Roseofilum halophilum]MDJ1179998.1 tetratricopeptide repeat protein [Roseofilum halophilum BLCC-M91]